MSLPALQDLFRRHREGQSGVWRLGTDPQRVIYLERGQVVFAQSTHPLDKLTTLLVERGKLTQAQLDYALQNLKPGVSIGRNLIEMGFITQRDLLEVARSQVERVVWGAMGTPEDTPVFEPKELDATVVRLPLDTPFLLLMGVLHLQDRERLLEVLGPLEQRPDLEGRPLPEMALPQDLARVPALLDGRRSLLDLAREAGAEPVRLGAFALYLREMGLVRLKLAPPPPAPLALESLIDDTFGNRIVPPPTPEMLLPEPPAPLVLEPPAPEPPAWEPMPAVALEPLRLDLPEAEPAAEPLVLEPLAFPALALEEEPLPGTAPAPAALPPSPLLAAIEAAQRPTMNLEHLSKALDATGEAPEELDTAAEVPPPAPPTSTLRSPEPTARIRQAKAAGTVQLPPVLHLDQSFPDEAETPRRRGLLWVLLLALVGAGAWFGYRWSLTRTGAPAPKGPTRTSPPANPAPAKPAEAPKAAAPEAPKAEPAPPEPPKPEPPKPEPTKAPEAASARPAAPASAADRLRTLQAGNWAKALEEGQAHRNALPRTHWALRLEVACQTETLAKAVELFKGRPVDLFLLPIAMRDGKKCTQVFLGDYATEAEAKAAIPGLPAPFLEPGARPRPYPAGAIPDRQ